MEPANPYISVLVPASAGSGKTYQLSRRFINLVAAGARPQDILTLTFTVKAANEMRSRIIAEATRLLVDKKRQEELTAEIDNFHTEARSRYEKLNFRLQKPRSSQATAKAILSATQSLQITTIDAIFFDWVRKFPFEAQEKDASSVIFQPVLELSEPTQKKALDQQAWERLFGQQESVELIHALWPKIQTHEERGILGVANKVIELGRLDSFLWSFSKTSKALRQHPLPHLAAGIRSLSDALLACSQHLRLIATGTTYEADYMPAIARGDFHTLTRLRLLTKSGRVSKAIIKGKKREILAEAIEAVDSTLASWINYGKLNRLNTIGEAFYSLYQHWQKARSHLKNKLGVLEFTDLAKGSYQIFHGENGTGASWLLQKSVHHLLIDEFQDTSFLQWSIFRKISEEILASNGILDGRRGSPATLFIVGDVKQSIYGFREADPSVLNHASDFLTQFGQSISPMNKSYRSCRLLLHLINGVFPKIMPGFPEHAPAQDTDGQDVIPDCGQIIWLPKAIDNHLDPILVEARQVASELASILQRPHNYPVFDSQTKTFRPLTAKDCCLLYRSSIHADAFEAALRQVGLACRREEQRGYFSRPEIHDALAFLRFLAQPTDVLCLLGILRSPLYALSDADLLALIPANGTEPTVTAIIAMLYEPTRLSLLNFIEKAQEQSIHQLLFDILTQRRAFSAYLDAFGEQEGRLAQKNLEKLVEIILHLEDDGYVSLSHVLNRLETLATEDTLGSALTDSQLITLMTIHKAKGLEFPLVVIIDAASSWYQLDRFWAKSTSGLNAGLFYLGPKQGWPEDDFPFEALIGQANNYLQSEANRLLYVAMTRASQYLIISGREGKDSKQNFHSLIEETLVSLGAFYDKSSRLVVERGLKPVSLESSVNKVESTDVFFLPVSNWDLPVEIDIIQPGRAEEEKTNSTFEIEKRSPRLAKALGIFIHKVFEEFWRDRTKSIDRQKLWQSMVYEPLFFLEHSFDKAKWQALEKEIFEQIDANIQSPSWQRWLKEADAIIPELPLIHLDGGKLVRGQVDLFLRMDQEVLIVDYKTQKFSLNSNQMMPSASYCQEMGYTRQLGLYARAIRAQLPMCQIHQAVCFSSLAHLVYL